MWFPRLEEQIDVGKDRLIKQVDLSTAKTITWQIHEDDWNYTGEIRVALVVDNLPEIPREAYDKKTMELKAKMDAYAIVYTSTNSGRKEVLRANRLIKNWYFTTNEPLSPDARIWESGGGSTLEFGLSGVKRYPFEDTYIVINIEKGDPNLAKANPRLQVVGEHDYAVSHHIGGLRIFRDTILAFLAICAITICYFSIKNNKKSNKSIKRDR